MILPKTSLSKGFGVSIFHVKGCSYCKMLKAQRNTCNYKEFFNLFVLFSYSETTALFFSRKFLFLRLQQSPTNLKVNDKI